MTRLLAFVAGSLLAAQGLAEPFEKLFGIPEGQLPSPL
jgi:tripeptidyl-peptidase-1